MKNAFNGGAAGLLSKLAVYPFDLTKKRLEVVNFEEARSKFGQVLSYKLEQRRSRKFAKRGGVPANRKNSWSLRIVF
jgi:hypothetical protein